MKNFEPEINGEANQKKKSLKKCFKEPNFETVKFCFSKKKSYTVRNRHIL